MTFSDTYNAMSIRRLERDTSVDRLSTGSATSNRSALSGFRAGAHCNPYDSDNLVLVDHPDLILERGTFMMMNGDVLSYSILLSQSVPTKFASDFATKDRR